MRTSVLLILCVIDLFYLFFYDLYLSRQPDICLKEVLFILPRQRREEEENSSNIFTQVFVRSDMICKYHVLTFFSKTNSFLRAKTCQSMSDTADTDRVCPEILLCHGGFPHFFGDGAGKGEGDTCQGMEYSFCTISGTRYNICVFPAGFLYGMGT